MDSTGFRDLVQKAQEGDRRAMDQVLAALRPYLKRIASSYADPVRPVRSTMDLLQDSCIRAWEKIGSFEGGDGDEETFAQFRAWIAQVVRRVGLNARRERQAARRGGKEKVLRLAPKGGGERTTVTGEMDPPSPGPTPSVNVRQDELRERIEEALKKLPRESDAEIVRLHYFHGLALPEVAKKLGLEYNHVRQRFRVSMRRLEKEVSNLL